MAKTIKWARDLHPIRERAARSRTETWSRTDLEDLFHVSRPTAQRLMKAIGGVQLVGGTHFIERPALLQFLDEMIEVPSVEEGLRVRLNEAPPPPRPKPLRVSLPEDLRHAMLPDLPANISLSAGRLEIVASTAIAMLESLMTLAMVMQNDLDRIRDVIEPPPEVRSMKNDDLRGMFERLREAELSGKSYA